MDVVRDLLDKQVVDRHGVDIGRVDSVILDCRGDGPPRVSGFEIGAAVLAGRIAPGLGRWAVAIERAFRLQDVRPIRVPMREVLEIGKVIKVNRSAEELGADIVERRLRGWISLLPGGRG